MDLVDTTGSGDVETSTVCKTTSEREREIVGLSGRKLSIPDHWSNPSGQWNVGIKAAFELFPSGPKSRIQVHKLSHLITFTDTHTIIVPIQYPACL